MTGRAGGGAMLTVVLIGVLWGLNWPAVKFMLASLPPLTLRAVAFPAAALLLALAALLKGEALRPARSERLPIAGTGLLLVFGFNLLTTFGQLLTETSRAAIIAYTMPALTAGLAATFLDEKLTLRIMAALAIGMAALLVLASEDLAGIAARPAGPVIMLLAALSWALGNIALKARRWSLSPLALTVWFFVISSLVIWPLVLLFEPPWRQTLPPPPVFAAMAYHVLGPMVICYLLWTRALGRLPATVAAIATLTAPIVGVLSSVLFLGDPATWQKMLALGMVVISIAVTLIPPQDRRRKAP